MRDGRHSRRFESRSKGSFTFRGAYAGEGRNPGWKLQRGIKSVTGGSSLTILSPNGGETWRRGHKVNITWSSTGSVTEVRIELSTNGGTTWKSIRSKTSNDGNERWQVKSAKTTCALVRISSVADPSVVDVSDGFFAIR